ncbi:MAG TPA: endolytic transglycosylase MltG [Candidatus Baltobacteraceae bacterium]|nr:endolytic transglycosylase MltG [Candidatus Baltobacteraceae bacterium]
MKAIAALVALAILAGAGWFAYAMLVDTSHPEATKDVIIARGSTFHDIAAQLAGAGIIGNETAFRVYAKMKRADTAAHAGEFRFSAHQTPAQVLAQLESGGAQVAKWVTIPEGFTAKQIAQRLQEQGFGDARTFTQAFLHDSIVVGGTRTKNLEGFLFPSTYLIPNGASAKNVEEMLTAQMRKELPADAARKAHARGLTVPQVVTLASLIEREAKADDERPLMAGVYYNRLRLGMPLEVDATIEYALPEHHDVITYGDLKIDSPYNSYLHTGLPPTPIANPGQASLQAAFNPKPSPYLYYVYKGNGHHAFARTLAEQNANIAKYLK